MKLSSSSLGSALPLTLVDGNPRPVRSTGMPPSAKAIEGNAQDRQSLLVITTSTASARAIQNALVPVDQKPLLRDTQNVSGPTFKTEEAKSVPSPLLTFARSIEGAEFCLADGNDSSDKAPGFDGLLWEFPQDDPDALVTAQQLSASAGSVPVVAVLFHAPPSHPQADALTEAGTSAGLLSMLPVADLNSAELADLLGNPFSSAVSPSESVDQLCQAIRTHAHDVRNPLNCVQMLVDLIREQIKSNEPISTTTLDQLTSSVERADAIVDNLSKLAKTNQIELSARSVS